MSFISHVILPDNSEYDLKGTLISVIGTQNSDTASWTGALPIDALTSGTTIAYYLPRGSNSNVTLAIPTPASVKSILTISDSPAREAGKWVSFGSIT